MAPIKWIQLVSGKTSSEILKEADIFIPETNPSATETDFIKPQTEEILHEDSINLLDQ